MAYKLFITPRASFDVADACAYYKSAQEGLDVRFLSELLNVYSKLAENPQHYSFISSKRNKGMRDISLKGFPYRVVFDINDDDVIVYSVFHSSRKPKNNL